MSPPSQMFCIFFDGFITSPFVINASHTVSSKGLWLDCRVWTILHSVTSQVVATSSIYDDFDGSSLNSRFVMQDVASLVFIFVVVEVSKYMEQKRARIIFAIELSIFNFFHLMMHSHIPQRFHCFFAHGVILAITFRIMVLVRHSNVLWPCPLQVKHCLWLVLVLGSIRVFTETILAMSEARGWPGLLESFDCMHWRWKNCPRSLQRRYQGHVKKPTVILEAVAS